MSDPCPFPLLLFYFVFADNGHAYRISIEQKSSRAAEQQKIPLIPL